MSDGMRRVDALRYKDDVFFENDIVNITYGYHPKRLIKGRIYTIDTLELKLDCSEVYGSHIVTFKYEDIRDIDHAQESEVKDGE